MSLQKELVFGSPTHAKILRMVLDRREASRRKMRQYHAKWDEADDSFRAYQTLTTEDSKRKSERKAGKPDYTTIVVPYSFATIMTAHTYWSSVFLDRAPVYQLQGRHGEAQDSVEAFEAALEYQFTVGRHAVPLFNWIFDLAKYGLGITGSYWDKETTLISRFIERPMTLGGIPLLGKKEKVLQTAELTKYEGNKLYNVRPHDWYPDPRVALVDFQKGEFCGRDTQVGWHEILDGQREGKYFNIDVLARQINEGGYDRDLGSSRVELPDGGDSSTQIPGPGFVNLHEMTIRLIPKTTGLSPVDRVEKWTLTIANNTVVIGAQPQGAYHDEFPFDIMEYGFGAHEFLKQSLTEVMMPLIDTLSWLFNSHMYNVRKALNDVRVVDPSRVVMKDLTSPIERGIVRLKPEAYGTDVRSAIHQLDVRDVTQTHLRDAAIVEQILQRVTGVVDELMGLSTGPDRESATGVRTRTGSAANRLKTTASYNSALGMTPMLAKLTSNTQQFMTVEQKFRIAGASSMKSARQFVEVQPELIAGQFDYVPVDGTLPVDRLAQANFWKELTLQLAQSPQLSMEWNLSEMVAHIMHLQGQKNVDRFRFQLMPPDQLQQGVQAGNVVPLGGPNGSGSRGRGPATGTPGALT